MKKILIIILFFSFFTDTHSQSILSKIYFTMDAKRKSDLYETRQSALFLENKPLTWSNYKWSSLEQWQTLIYSYGVGFTLNRKHSIEFLRSKEQYLGGFHVGFLNKDAISNSHIMSLNIEDGLNYIFRYNYKVGLPKLKLVLSPAYIFSKSRHYNGFWPYNGNFTTPQLDINGVPRFITFQVSDIIYQDYALSKYFHSVDAKARLEYTPWKWLSLFYGGGYTRGFNKLAYFNVKYTIEGFPEQHAINETYGTNYYTTFGCRINPSLSWSSEKAKQIARKMFLPQPKHKKK